MTAPGGLGGGDGVLSFTVWPTHAGAVRRNGDEPIFQADYRRGQIAWAVNGAGGLLGHTTIDVPAGEYHWVIYCHDPYKPGYVTAQKLAHPLILDAPGTIDLTGITEAEVRPLNPDPVLHD